MPIASPTSDVRRSDFMNAIMAIIVYSFSQSNFFNHQISLDAHYRLQNHVTKEYETENQTFTAALEEAMEEAFEALEEAREPARLECVDESLVIRLIRDDFRLAALMVSMSSLVRTPVRTNTSRYLLSTAAILPISFKFRVTRTKFRFIASARTIFR